MPKLRAIRTPWSQQWRRIRYQVLPLVVFGGVMLLTISLWRRHAGLPNAVGEVEAIRYEMAAPMGGVLVALSRPDWQPYDVVEANAVIARLDDTTLRAGIAVQRSQIARLQARIVEEARFRETASQLAHTEATFDYTAAVDARRLAADVEQLRLAILDRKAVIAADKVDFERQSERFKEIEKLVKQGVETQWAYWNARLRKDVVEERLASNRKALAEVENQRDAAVARRNEHAAKVKAMPGVKLAELQSALDPIRADVKVQEAQIGELEAQVKATVVRSPVKGTVCEILRRPGEAVVQGQTIIAVTAELPERHIISYIREHQGVRPQVDMPVTVRIRTFPVQTVRARITQVGPRVEQVPRHHLADARTREWGLPVRIALPPDVPVQPGELVDVTFGALP